VEEEEEGGDAVGVMTVNEPVELLERVEFG
jgi:hypothetical protein